jgi:hypothetical protein
VSKRKADRTPQWLVSMGTGTDICSDYVFFFSYIQVEPKEGGALWSNAQQMADINGQYRILRRATVHCQVRH